jgi:ABC-type Fe3+/spermidine/putrescine transport system ATPase subunit
VTRLPISASGLLLHPSIGDMVDETVSIQGHKIRFAMVDPAASPAAIRTQLLRLSVGYVFQDYALFPHRTVLENVAAALTRWYLRLLPPAERQEINALLDAFELTEIRTRFRAATATARGSPQRATSLWHPDDLDYP